MTLCAPPTSASDSFAEAGLLRTEFTTERSVFDWYVVNDNVMGGRSPGTFRIEQGGLDFVGNTNTRWRGRQVSYRGDFDTQDGVWNTVDIPFSRFVPQFQGIRLGGPALDPGQITGMSLMIEDKLDGPFELSLASVRAYPTQAPFALEHYRWKNRILVVSARSRDDVKLAELQTELASTPEEFADRDMVLVTLLNYGTSMVGDRELTAAEAAATRDAVGIQTGSFALRLIGKDGSVKLATESPTPIKEIYALIDTMPMRKREHPDR